MHPNYVSCYWTLATTRHAVWLRFLSERSFWFSFWTIYQLIAPDMRDSSHKYRVSWSRKGFIHAVVCLVRKSKVECACTCLFPVRRYRKPNISKVLFTKGPIHNILDIEFQYQTGCWVKITVILVSLKSWVISKFVWSKNELIILKQNKKQIKKKQQNKNKHNKQKIII